MYFHCAILLTEISMRKKQRLIPKLCTSPIAVATHVVLFSAFTFALPITLTLSCNLRATFIEAPPEVRELAWETAQEYLGMEYEWGGQDFPTPRGIDCSGLVVNVYYEAVEHFGYFLPFTDAAVVNFYNEYTEPLDVPGKGDLIFMGDGEISHIAIFEKNEAGQIWFIDAYSESGYVEYRSYPEDSPKIMDFGRLLIEER